MSCSSLINISFSLDFFAKSMHDDDMLNTDICNWVITCMILMAQRLSMLELRAGYEMHD